MNDQMKKILKRIEPDDLDKLAKEMFYGQAIYEAAIIIRKLKKEAKDDDFEVPQQVD